GGGVRKIEGAVGGHSTGIVGGDTAAGQGVYETVRHSDNAHAIVDAVGNYQIVVAIHGDPQNVEVGADGHAAIAGTAAGTCPGVIGNHAGRVDLADEGIAILDKIQVTHRIHGHAGGIDQGGIEGNVRVSRSKVPVRRGGVEARIAGDRSVGRDH